MAFKGTRRIGTTDWAREAPLLEALDETFYELREAKRAWRAGAVKVLDEKLKALQV